MKVYISDYVTTGDDGEVARVQEVEIEKHDLYNVDTTLALIIHPMLVKFRENVQSFPEDLLDKDFADAPEELRTFVTRDDGTNNGFARWCYILDEMIFAFDYMKNKWQRDEEINDKIFHEIEEYLAYHRRVSRGTLFFGRYYSRLWD